MCNMVKKKPTCGHHRPTLDTMLADDPSAVARITTDSPFSTSDYNRVKFDLLFETGTKTNLRSTLKAYA